MAWNSEAEFVNSFLSTIKHKNSSTKNNFQIWTEVRTGFGRPDILIIEYNSKVLDKRCKYEQQKFNNDLSTISAYALSYLSTCRWVKKESLGKFLNASHSKLLSVLKEIELRGLVDVNDHLVKLKPRSEILGVTRIEVFEAKLFNWMEAVEQAERHLWFTNDSSILMPNVSDKRIEIISSECKKRGIGLSLFSESTEYSTILKPKQSGIQNSPMLWQINEKLAGGLYEREPVFC